MNTPMLEASGIMVRQVPASPELLVRNSQGLTSNHRTNGGTVIRVRKLSFSTTSITVVSASGITLRSGRIVTPALERPRAARFHSVTKYL